MAAAEVLGDPLHQVARAPRADRRSRLLAATLSGLAAALGGCGTSGAPAAAPPARQAAASANRLLADVRLPPGSRRSATTPPGGLVLVRRPPAPDGPSPPPAPSGAVTAVRSGWWVAPGSIDAVSAWLSAHPPAGTIATAESSMSRAGLRRTRPEGTTSVSFDFQIPPSGHLALRQTLVGLAPGARGTTIVRVITRSTWTPEVSQAARVAGRIAPARACLRRHGFVLLGGGAAPANQRGGPLGELSVAVRGSRSPAIVAFYASPQDARRNRSALARNAGRFGGAVAIVGSHAVIWPHGIDPVISSALGRCLAG